MHLVALAGDEVLHVEDHLFIVESAILFVNRGNKLLARHWRSRVSLAARPRSAGSLAARSPLDIKID
jgi:hypothetical protein